MGYDPLYPDDIDPSKAGVYYYKDSKSLRIITDDGDMWLGRSLTVPGGLFIAVGDEMADPSFVIKPGLLGVLSTYIEVLANDYAQTVAEAEAEADGDSGDWPGQ